MTNPKDKDLEKKILKQELAETNKRLLATLDYVVTLEERCASWKKIARKFQEMALIDGLTEVPNRRFFDITFDEIFQKRLAGTEKIARKRSSDKNQGPLTLLLVDIDFFKPYNDVSGHPAGDKALRQVASAMKSSLRSNDFLARYGGEEFVVILPNTSHTEAQLVAERARKAVENLGIPHPGSGTSEVVTVSIGLAALSGELSPEEFLEAADKALYNAKRKGRNCVYYD